MIYLRSTLLKKVAAHIKKGGVIAYATESCFGFGCDPLNFRAINKIIKLKKRANNKGLIIVSGQKSHLQRVIVEDLTNPEFKKYWPGSYSLILNVKKSVPHNLTGSHKTLAVRVTKHKQIQQITRHLNMPIVSTSANKSGCISTKTYRECHKKFGKSVLVLPGITNFAKKPSQIIDWATKKRLR